MKNKKRMHKASALAALSSAFMAFAAQRYEFKQFTKMNGRSKYTPHQGVEECRRRREKMGTGEYSPKSMYG